MTLVNIDIKNIASETHPDDRVVFYSPILREAPGGGITSTAETVVPLVDGVGEIELVPGPVTVTFQCRGIADTRPKSGTVPDTGPVGIEDIIAGAFEYLPPVVNRGLDEINDVLAAALTAITSAPYLGASNDLNTALARGANTRGYWSVAPDTANAPTSYAGVVDVTASSNNRQFTQTFHRIDGPGIWKREITDRTHIVPGQWVFTPWKRIDEDVRVDALTERMGAPLPAGTDFDTLTIPRTWRIPYSGWSWPNQPAEGPGELVVSDTGNSTGNIQMQEMTTTNPTRVFRRFRNSAGVWQKWVESGRHDVAHIDPGSGRRDTIVEAGLQRRGGVVGTGGKGAIALRFDHHLAQFGTKVLPLLKQYRLPWGQMLNPGNRGSGNDTWTWGQIAQECHQSGGEVWNHSWSHTDVTHPAHADAQITNALTSLRDNLPSLWIDSWAPPGQSSYLGYEGQDTPEKHWDTYPGRLILAQHAFVRGYYPGIYQPLSAPNLVGASHATIDAQTAAWVQAAIRGARDTASGLTLMLHPNYLDQSGYMTTAQLGQVLAYIAQLRDAGEIVVLSNAGILMADAGTPTRQTNMLSNAGAGTNTGAWSQAVTSRSYRAHLGVPHEAEAWVKGSGQVTLKVEVASPTNPVTAQHQVTLRSSPQRMSVLVTPPNDTTGITVSLTGNVQHTGVNYRPI